MATNIRLKAARVPGACLKIAWSAAARAFDRGQGSEGRAGLATGASRQWAGRSEPTPTRGKRRAAQRVLRLRCPGFVAPRSKTHEGYSPSSRLASPTDPQKQRGHGIFRKALQGLTQRQLAEQVGTREIEISRIETGRSAPDGPMKQRIAAVLEKPTFELFDC